MKARVYTETTVHSPDGAYQLAILEFPGGERQTVRIAGPRVAIGDEVDWPYAAPPDAEPVDSSTPH